MPRTAAPAATPAIPTTPPGSVVLQIPGFVFPAAGFVLGMRCAALPPADAVMLEPGVVFAVRSVVLCVPGSAVSVPGLLVGEPAPAVGIAVFVM
ncbi:MAG TPA: hypothetical protein VH988_33255 [Thermoanaerobaculia bacterium]|jgi:hypothetical protein|nr:hypothetical protein [Thermoanaerobaculia bacterium]